MHRHLASWTLSGILAWSIASAADWREIATDTAGNRYSVDQESIVREGSTVKATVRTDYATPRSDAASGKSIQAALDRMVIDCETTSFALQARAYLAGDGSELPVLASTREQVRLRVATPGSMSETIVRSLCRTPRAK